MNDVDADAPHLIAHVVFRFAVGGLENGLVNLVNRLPSKDWRHVIISLTDVDATFAQAVAAGATSIMPVEDKYYGERMGGVIDPFGIVWWVSTHTEDIPPEQLQARALAFKNAKSAAQA